MRLRHSLAAAVCALAFAVTCPVPAQAAAGDFTYVNVYRDGGQGPGGLQDPPGRECVTLPEVVSGEADHAVAPRNLTDATATVFTEPDCTGDHYTLRPGGSAGPRLLLRSVVFS